MEIISPGDVAGMRFLANILDPEPNEAMSRYLRGLAEMLENTKKELEEFREDNANLREVVSGIRREFFSISIYGLEAKVAFDRLRKSSSSDEKSGEWDVLLEYIECAMRIEDIAKDLDLSKYDS